MAIFNQLSKAEIAQTYTHYGFFCGIVPIYFAEDGPDGAIVDVRNWCPEWVMHIAEALFGICCTIKCTIDPSYEPVFPFKITGEIKK